ncbi:MAG: N-acetylmuramate alpha-1-phosphate uridylyltransferase MurU [Gammaproteobacteria bacterium]
MHAMILAAGRGERMRPLTDRRPKPLLEAGGKPLIVWHLEALATAGFRDVVINHAHLGGMIEEALGDGSQWRLRLSYSAEEPALETAGGIARALPRLGTRPFLVLNGDVSCDFPLARAHTIATQMRAASLLAWCVLVPNPPHHREGDFGLRDGLLEAAPEFVGVPPSGRLTFSGIGVYDPALFRGLGGDEPARLAPLLRKAAEARRCGAERHDGRWIDVGTPERLAALDAQLRSG